MEVEAADQVFFQLCYTEAKPSLHQIASEALKILYKFL